MDTVTTPKRNNSRRLSISEYDSDEHHTEQGIKQEREGLLATPSPPSSRTRHHQGSRPPVSFLATPVRTRLVHLDDDTDVNKDMDTNPHLNVSPYVKSLQTSPNNTHGKSRLLLPPATPKTRNTEMFLSPSPKLKSPGGGNSLITKENKPIRDISNDLKTRLNYAFVKLQNGWVDKTLPELEQKFDHPHHQHHNSVGNTILVSPDRIRDQIRRTSISGVSTTSYVNKFAHGNGDDMSPFAQLQRSVKITTHTNKKPVIVNNDITMEDTTTSAHLAFLHALSSPKKNQSTGGNDISRNVSPLKWNGNENQTITITADDKSNNKTVKRDKYGNPIVGEEEAVETLMSLSSPHKSQPSQRIGETTTDTDVNQLDDTDIETDIDSD